MLPSNKKNRWVGSPLLGACRIRHGYGATRGTPVGRQRASGSSAAIRPFMSFSASGSRTISWPGIRPSLMLPTGPPPTQTPERSGLPFGSRGAGPFGFGPAGALFAPPLPAGEVAATGVCCASAREQSAHAASAVQSMRDRSETTIGSAAVVRRRAREHLVPVRERDRARVRHVRAAARERALDG